MEGCFMFQLGGDCFSDGGLHFQVGGVPHGGHRFSWEGCLKKIVGWGWGAHPHAPHTMGGPDTYTIS